MRKTLKEGKNTSQIRKYHRMRKHYPEKRILAKIENTYQKENTSQMKKALTRGENTRRMRKYYSEEKIPAK
jgi:hypothetical protein